MTSPAQDDPREVFGVGEITRKIKYLLQDELGTLWVEGEISNCRPATSGHVYFSLKDDSAQLSAVAWRSTAGKLPFPLKDGLKIRAYGAIDVYEPRGSYQLIVRKAEEAGKGSLQEAFEKLKAKLLEEGLFNEENKQKLPLLPLRIGVVTSPTGAAFQDILNVLNRRFPNLHIILAPTRVQGEGAAEEIASAISNLDRSQKVEVMIVGRGGGSLEDLWAFNEEPVARAIAAARTPIISAVGHEIDFTIADFCADERAPTPSAAAELVVGQKEAFEETLHQLGTNLARHLKTHLLEIKTRFIRTRSSYVFKEPENLLRHHRQQVERLGQSLNHETVTRVRHHQQSMDEWTLKARHVLQNQFATTKHRIESLNGRLQALAPEGVLKRGYSITLGKDGKVLVDASSVKKGDQLETHLSKGKIISRSERTDKD